jgi:hypothetical protein
MRAPSTARPSATLSTGEVVPSPHALTGPTRAPCVDRPNTEPKPVPTDPFRVSSLLHPDIWESELRLLGLWEKFSDVPDGLRHGFRIGAHHPVHTTHTPANHQSALMQPEVIEKHIISELAADRYAGPYSRSQLELLIGPFQSAPLGVVEKSSTPGSFRIVQDFSFSRDHHTTPSLNDQIDTEDFPCMWGTFDDVVRALANAPENTQAATFDVESAYRQIPIHPSDWPHIVFMWDNRFYIDKRVPFGAASSNGLFARCGDSAMTMYELRGFGIVIKWVDDFLFIQYPATGLRDTALPPLFSEQAIYDYGASLGLPWKRSKTMPFALRFRYLGFDWDIPARKVYIPDAKRDKYLSRAGSWADASKVSLKETEQLVGSLVHCTMVIPDGKPHLTGLIKFLAAFSASNLPPYLRRSPSHLASSDVSWWKNRLSVPHEGLSIANPPPNAGITVFTDASMHGLGVIVDHEFLAWPLQPNWNTGDRNIGWAEAIAVEMAIHWLIKAGWRDASVTINCDNQGVVYAWQAGRSRNLSQNSTIARCMATAASAGLRVSLKYVNTTENPADAPSRGVSPPGYSKANIDIPIPEHLAHAIAHV